MAAPGSFARPPHAPPGMRRPSALLVAGLFALAAGLGMLHVATDLRTTVPLAPGERVGAESNRAAAWRFYSALDAALATGDVHPLRAAVATGFVDHRPGAATGGSAGLAHEVAALRRARPGARLSAEALVVDGDVVLAYVSVRDAAPSRAPYRVPLAAPATWDTIELVRVAAGVVTERWILGSASDSVAVLEATPVPPPAASPTAPASAADDPLCGATFCT